MDGALGRTVRQQSGVVGRQQLLAAGWSSKRVRWRVASGRWRTLHPGVFLTHDGPVDWRARAWAGVLWAGRGAALSGTSAAYQLGIVRRVPSLVEVSVPSDRRVADRPGLRVRTRTDLDRCVVRTSPPTTRRDETVLDLLPACRDEDAVVGLLCDGLRAGADPRTLRELLGPRPRWRWRGLALQALADCELGVESPLERRFHRDVLAAHRLPPFELQVREKLDGSWIRADARCAALGVRAELDGRLAHPDGRTDEDTWRDNDVIIATSEITLRYRWRHVAGNPCRTALQVSAALRSRGWTGRAQPCRRCPRR